MRGQLRTERCPLAPQRETGTPDSAVSEQQEWEALEGARGQAGAWRIKHRQLDTAGLLHREKKGGRS